jgi:sulfate permease, SulP family
MSQQTPADLLPGAAYIRRAAQLTLRDWRGLLERRSLAPNLMAGLTVTMVALPLNVALAIAAGLPSSAGLVAGAVAGVIGALFGGARLSVTGPEVALAPITLEIASRHGLTGLAAATLLAGLMQMVFGFCRVGALVHAIPLPVVGGFLAAVGLLVFETQLPRLLGLPAELKSIADFRPSEHLSQIEPTAIAVGLLVVALMVVLPRLHKRIPAPLVGLCLAVLAVFVLRLPLPTVAPFDGAFPRPSLPRFGELNMLALLPEALALAMLASIDSLLCAVSVDALRGGERTRTDQELVAQGLANVTSACFSGMPVAAAVVRSVAAHEAGATTRLAPLTQSLSLVVVLLALSSWLVHVPLVALAAILLVVGYRLIQLRQLAVMWRMARFEAAIFAVTAAGILCTDFVVGVAIGVIAALVQFAHRQRSALRMEPALLEQRRAGERDSLNEGDEPRLLRLEGPLFFGSQRSVEDAVHAMHSGGRVVVDISGISTVDLSGATTLASALRQLAQRGVRVQVSTFGEPLDPLLRWALERQETGELVHVEAVDASTARATARSRPPHAPTSATIQAPTT